MSLSIDAIAKLWLPRLERVFPSLRRWRSWRHAADAIDSVNAGYWVIDAQGRFLEVNDAYCRMVGYSRGRIMAMRIADFEAIATDQQIRGQIQRILTNGQEQFETRHRRSDGTWLDLEVTVTAKGPDELIVYLRDITERKRAALEINQLAFYDALTGLPNRRLLHDRLEQTLVSATRQHSHCALHFLDLNHLKNLNEALGHAKGDRLLMEVAQRLLACLESGDYVARFGGDEFVVVQIGLGADCDVATEKARYLAQKILDQLADSHSMEGLDYSVTASLGITMFCDESSTSGDLLRQADLAMYHAKAVSGSAYQFFNASMQAAADRRNHLEAELRTALREGQWVLHYQPQLDRHRRVVGAEALVRWQHPKLGLIPPAEFVPLAEESGLIIDLGHWILDTACRQLAAWSQVPGLQHLSLAVNVSAQQLHDDNFVDRVQTILRRTGADPKRLKLEITESVLLNDIEAVIRKMNLLRNAGIQFALDDFGTGYCSLSYLSRLPVDELKIDRSFVNNLAFSESAILICISVLGLAHGLRIKVVAEGVESEAQFEFLTLEHPCDLLQGYLFSKPVPAEGFAAFALRSAAVASDPSDPETEDTNPPSPGLPEQMAL